LRKKIVMLEDQLKGANNELQIVQNLVDSYEKISHDLNLANTEVKTKVEEAQNGLQETKSSTFQLIKALEQEKSEVFRLQEESQMLKMKVDFNTQYGKKQGDTLQEDQLNHYKKIVHCQLCKERLKSCVIARCYHTFCRECINARIEAGDKTCPNPTCKTPFRENEVHNIYI